MKTWHWLLIGTLFAITLGLEFILLGDYDAHWWNAIPAFYALFGFVCCIIIIYIAKFIAKTIVKRDIHYYD